MTTPCMPDDYNVIAKILDTINLISSNTVTLAEVPESIFDETDQKIKLSDHIIQNNNDSEYKSLSKNSLGEKIKLTKSQLSTVRKTGGFSVTSIKFPELNYQWKVSKLIQSGTTNLKNDLYKNFASAVGILINKIPKRITSVNHISYYSAIKQIFKSITEIPALFLGATHRNHVYDRSTILQLENAKLNEMTFNDMFFIDNDVLLYVANGTTIPIYTLNQYKKIISKLKAPYNEFINKWNADAKARRLELYNKYKNDALNNEELLLLLTVKDLELTQYQIFEFIQETLPEEQAEKIFNLSNNLLLFRNGVDDYNKQMNLSINNYRELLKDNHKILSLIPSWLESKVMTFSKNYSLTNNFSNHMESIVKQFDGQEGLIYNAKQSIKKSIEYVNYCDNVKSTKIHTAQFTYYRYKWKFFPWFSDKATKLYPSEIMLSDNKLDSSSKPYTTNTITTFNYGWKIRMLLLSTLYDVNNVILGLSNAMIRGKYGIRSLYGFSSYTNFDESSSYYYKNKTYNTWFGKISNLWSNINTSRTEFENNPSAGMLGKKKSRFFNIMSNYVIKGLIGIPGLLILHLVSVIICTILSLIGIIISPFICTFWRLGLYIFTVLIKDQYNPNCTKWSLFPLVKIIVWKMLINGCGSAVIATIIIIFYVLIMIGIIIFGTGKFTLKYLYDTIIFYLLINKRANVPEDNDMLSYLVPESNFANHYYIINKELALIAIQQSMQEITLQAYKHHCNNQIASSRNKLNKYLSLFTRAGISIAISHDLSMKFTKNENYLNNLLVNNCIDFNKKSHIIDDILYSHQIYLSNEDLLFVIKHGAILCENYFYANTYQYDSNIWTALEITENDWIGLAGCCLTKIFGHQIINRLTEDVSITNINIDVRDSYAKLNINEFAIDNNDDDIPNLFLSKTAITNYRVISPNNIFKLVNANLEYDLFIDYELIKHLFDLDNTINGQANSESNNQLYSFNITDSLENKIFEPVIESTIESTIEPTIESTFEFINRSSTLTETVIEI